MVEFATQSFLTRVFVYLSTESKDNSDNSNNIPLKLTEHRNQVVDKKKSQKLKSVPLSPTCWDGLEVTDENSYMSRKEVICPAADIYRRLFLGYF